MKYDGLGRRVSKEIQNSADWNHAYHYYYDGQSIVEERNSNDRVIKQHVWGLQYVDELVQTGLNDNPAGDQTCDTYYWVCQDANYNVIGLLASNGDLKERYEYTPYGQRVAYKSAGSADLLCMSPMLAHSQAFVISTVDQPYGLCDFGMQGKLYNKEYGLYTWGVRDYHPALARGGQPDPTGNPDGPSRFEWERSKPVVGLDPTGLKWIVFHKSSEVRGTACATDSSDTFEDLAKHKRVMLGSRQYDRWLTGPSGGPVPLGSKPLPGIWYRWPNVFVVIMGSELSQDHKSDLSYRDRPLAVQMVADAASDGRYAIFIEHPSRSVLERYLGYKDLWGLGFFGHGGLSYYDDSDPHIHWALGERLARLARRGRHGLSYMVFNMCDGGGWGDALGEGNENRRSKETIGPRYMGWDEGDYERHTDNWERAGFAYFPVTTMLKHSTPIPPPSPPPPHAPPSFGPYPAPGTSFVDPSGRTIYR